LRYSCWCWKGTQC